MSLNKNRHIRLRSLLMAFSLLLFSACELILPNKPPYVELLNLEGDISMLPTETLNLSINAYDVDGKITGVEFIMDDDIIGTDEEEPYEFQLKAANFVVGEHTLGIKAHDNDKSFYHITRKVTIAGVGTVSAGIDVHLDNGKNFVQLDAQMPTGSTGTWSTVPEGQGTFSDISNPKAIFTGTLCNSYLLRWTVNTGAKVETDDVTIQFSHTPSEAVAGEDKHFSDGRLKFFLEAEEPEVGEGNWSIFGGVGGNLEDPTDPNSLFTGRACTDYFLIWSVSTACETKRDTIFMRFDQVVVTANAGADQTFINGTKSTRLQGNDPGAFEAEWTIMSGTNGKLSNAADPESIFTGELCETYVLRYRIVSGCGFSDDFVTINFKHSPSTAEAGSNLIFADGRTSAFLDANEPEVGDATWEIISGTGGIVDDPTDPGSRFIGAQCETYVLKWTITATCGSSSDEVTVTFGHEPTLASAGGDQYISTGALSTILSANTAAEGTGSWSVIEGAGGVFSDPADPTATFTGQLCGSYILQWKIATDCKESFDQVRIVFDQVDVPSFAGPDLSFFDGTVQTALNGNDPQSATGIWTILSGENGVLSDVNDPNATLSGVLGQVYVLRWSISSTCGSSSDEVKIAFLSTGFFVDTRNGENYPTILIGDQEWMAKNLNYKTVNYSWAYSDQNSLRNEYGLLYNYEAANQACPDGWHLPTDTEWRELEKALGMPSGTTLSFGYRGTTEGAELKEAGLQHWHTPNHDAVNLIGFTALPSGYRDVNGNYGLLGSMGAFWTATLESGGNRAIYRALNKDKQSIGRDWFNVKNGAAVRCIKD